MSTVATMPWWALLAFVGYASMFVWELTRVINQKRLIVPISMNFAFKVTTIVAAASYWDVNICKPIVDHLGPPTSDVNDPGLQTFIFLTLAALLEAARIMKVVLVDKPQPSSEDNFYIVFWTLAAIVFPAFMLYFAFKMLVLHRCIIGGASWFS